MDTLFTLVPGASGILLSSLAVLAPAFVVAGYLAILLDRRRDGSASKDDRQVGLKLVFYALALAGLAITATGAFVLLSYVLSGFKGGTDPIKRALAHLISGGAVFAGTVLVLLPATNTKDFPQVERFAIGTVGTIAGLGAVMALNGFVTGLFTGEGWTSTAGHLAELLVCGGAAFVAISRHGTLSGWTAPTRAAAQPAAGYPYPGQQAQPGYGQPGYQQGYPPAAGAYGQQGYPQQQGGYPPTGSGYPPQGTGGSGGYPPR
jgi:hypothetical protein